MCQSIELLETTELLDLQAILGLDCGTGNETSSILLNSLIVGDDINIA